MRGPSLIQNMNDAKLVFASANDPKPYLEWTVDIDGSSMSSVAMFAIPDVLSLLDAPMNST